MAWLSLRAYARSRGVRLAAVQKAIESGRVTAVQRDEITGYLKGIDPEIADREWAVNTDQGQAEKSGASFTLPESFADDVMVAVPEAEDEGPSYQEHRAKREAYNAQLTQLELLRELQLVTPTADVAKAAAAVARIVREALLVVPDRVSDLVAAETDAGRVHAILANEIRQALTAISHGTGPTDPEGPR
jgi:hypothetical protein